MFSDSQHSPPGAWRRQAALIVLLLLIFLAPSAFRIPCRFALARAVLIGLGLVFEGRDGWQRLGLRARLRDVLAAGLLGLGVWRLATLAVADLARQSGLVFVPFDSIELAFGKPLFQSLNEEILLRAVLLGLLATCFVKAATGSGSMLAITRLTNSQRWIITVAAAAVFSILHLVYYNLISQINPGPVALLTLFFVGFALNGFFVRTGHILFGVAIHAGWNLARFGGRFYSTDPASGALTYVNYAQTFDFLEGSIQVLLAAGLLAVVSGWVLFAARPKPTT